MEVGLAGKVRCVVYKENGEVKSDSGFQKNLILNQGLEFYGSNTTEMIATKCLVGTGNSTPTVTQVKLDEPIKIASGTLYSSKFDYEPREDNLYVCEFVYRYLFATMGDVNVSEVGLASSGTNLVNPYQCTRALLKDSLGNPTAISVLNNERLEVFYKIYVVYSTLDYMSQIQYTGADKITKTYNCVTRLSNAGVAGCYNHYQSNQLIGRMPLRAVVLGPYSKGDTYTGELGEVNEYPKGSKGSTYSEASDFTMDPYVPNSYKNILRYNYALGDGNGYTRSIYFVTLMGAWQIRYGAVLDDERINKSSKDIMSLAIEISWGRYEGEL